MDEKSIELPVEELHAKRAIAMACKFIDQFESMDELLRKNRISCLLRSLKPLSKSDSLSAYLSEQIRSSIKSLKERKKLVNSKSTQQIENKVSTSSSGVQENRNLANSNKQSISSSLPQSQNEEESVDKIQNLLIEQKVNISCYCRRMKCV